jgi:hypothetical protein
MHRSIFAAAIALGACMQEGSSQAAGPIQTLRVGNWSGGSYTNDRTGAFSHCVANAPYMSGISFFVSVNSSFQWSIGFASPAWQLVSGETIPVDLTFDGRSQYHVLATALTSQLAAIPMPNNSTLIRTFRGARQMQALARGQLLGSTSTKLRCCRRLWWTACERTSACQWLQDLPCHRPGEHQW